MPIPAADEFPARKQLTVTAIVGAVVFAIAGAWVLIASRTPFDRPAHTLARDLADGTGETVARLVTHFGDAPMMYAVAALATVLLLALRRLPEATVMGFGMLLTIGFVRLGKMIVDRSRPADQLANALGHSFPSGHSAYGFAWVVIGVIAVRTVPGLLGRRWPVWFGAAIAVLVPITRVYLRAHWASDTIAGLGEAMMSFSLVALAVLAIVKRGSAEAAL